MTNDPRPAAPSPSPTGSPNSAFWTEAAAALAFFGVLIGWSHRKIIFGGQVNSFFAFSSIKTAIRSIYEPVYQLAPLQWTTADLVHHGIFPSWTPLAEAGTPLIGKMIGGVFSPFHLPFYILPFSGMPHWMSLTPLLTALFADGFVYL